MKNFFMILSIFGTAIVLSILSCTKSNTDARKGPTPLVLKIPEGWPQPVYNFSANPLTNEGFELGKKLFYDGRLSKDGNFPCASCHQQFAGFATFDHGLSHGFNNQFTTRNAPGIFNMIFLDKLHWDGGINYLETQPLAHITAPNEMGETIENVLAKLRADSIYTRMFSDAFGDPEITSPRMMLALTQFVGSITSFNTPYDKMKRGQIEFTAYEKEGYRIFQAKCAGCHKEPLLTDNSFRNNGLEMNPTLRDMGRMRITGLASDSLHFKVPSLRNVMLTFPYMHDGRFPSLLSVLDHYSDGVISSPTLDPALFNKIPLDAAEKLYLLEFFKTLTDSVLINDPRLAAPR